jgi:hypothetical protein
MLDMKPSFRAQSPRPSSGGEVLSVACPNAGLPYEGGIVTSDLTGRNEFAGQ